jgi:multiple sugar transport system permease protein
VGTPAFQGFDNYTSLLTYHEFQQSLLVTLEVALGTSIPTTLLAFVLALLLNAGVRGTSWYQTLFFLPTVLPTVVTAIVWALMYQGNGVINVSLGLAAPWLTDARWALPAVILMMIWTNMGYFVIILLAGVRDIPPEYSEAVRIDGANAWGVVWYILLPLIRPILLFVLVIATTGALTLFTQPFLLTQGGPAGATRPLAELIYDLAFNYLDIGKATAVSFVLLVLALLVAYVQFYVLRPKDQ